MSTHATSVTQLVRQTLAANPTILTISELYRQVLAAYPQVEAFSAKGTHNTCSRVIKAWRAGSPASGGAAGGAPTEAAPEATPEDELLTDRLTRKLAGEVKDLKRRYQTVLAALELEERRTEAALAIREPTAELRIEPRLSQGSHEATAIALYSDWHIEERVDLQQLNGLNEYTPEIAERRAIACFQNTLRLVQKERGAVQIDDLVLWLGGDFITGFIHEELAQTNWLAPTEATRLAKKLLHNGIKFLLEYGKFKSIRILCNPGNHGRCHDDQTELLTKEGWKTYDQLRVGELVATYKMADGDAEWQPLKEVYTALWHGEMYHVKHNTADFMVTPEHRMVTRSTHNGTAEFTEMQAFDARKTLGGRFIPKFAKGVQVDLASVSDDELTLMGWIMTDGSYHKTRPDIAIYQSKPEGVAAIEALLDRMGYTYTHARRTRKPPVINGKQCKTSREQHTFNISRRHHERITELVPDKKAIPTLFHELSQRQVEVFLAALLAGDGSKQSAGRNSGFAELHGKEEFLSQVQALLMVNGRSSRIRKDTRGAAVLSVRSTEQLHILNWEQSVTKVPYAGIIWCGTVENGTLITRRNGIPLISGNTTTKMQIANSHRMSYEWMMYHDLADLFKDEPTVDFDIPTSPFGYIRVYDKTIRTLHGEAIKYGGGIGGVAIPMIKHVQRLNKQRPADMTVIGHFHQSIRPAKDIIVNGSLIGFSPYAQKIGCDPEVASQTFLLCDKKHGFTVTCPIHVQ